MINYISGKEANQIRAILRKALKDGRLLIRTVWYNYYDSPTPGDHTPNAEFVLAIENNHIRNEDLKSARYSYGISIDDIKPEIIRLYKHWIVKEVRIKSDKEIFNEKFAEKIENEFICQKHVNCNCKDTNHKTCSCTPF